MMRAALGRNMAPVRVVVLLVLLTAGVLTAAALFLAAQPYLGFETRPASDAVLIHAVDARGPSAGRLKAGERLVAIEHAGQLEPLRARDAFAEIDVAERTLGQLHTYRQHQGALLEILRQPASQWITDDGRFIPIRAEARRSVFSLPANFWFHGLVALIGIAISAGVWAYRRNDWAARGFLAMGVGLAIAAASAGVYTSRELALGSQALWTLSALNQIGTQLYSGGYVVTMLRYPQVLGSVRQCRWILAGFLVWALVFGAAQPWDAMPTDLAFRAPILLALSWALVLAVRQWLASRNRPVERAALLWYLFAWFVGGVAFVVMQILPVLLGETSPSETQVFAFGFLLLTNIGIALGVVRYRLFELGAWWARAWGAVLGGGLVIAVDALILSVLRLDTGLSLALSLALVGWAYFPLRQILWRRLTRSPMARDEGALLKAVLQASGDSAQASWQRLLTNVYQPLEIHPVAENPDCARVAQDGAALIVPGPEQGTLLKWVARGRRLADSNDAQLADRLSRLFARIRQYREAVAEGAQLERQRIAQDLHDDVGARLLSVRQRVDASTAEAVTEILADIRTIVHSLAGQNPLLAECLADCRNELADRCEQADIHWRWPMQTSLPTLRLSAQWSLDLVRIMRELTNNAIKHAAPSRIAVSLQITGQALRFEFRHDATRPFAPPDAWRQNLGLRNLVRRCRAHGGEIRWASDEASADVVFQGTLSLPQNAGGEHAAEPAEYAFASAPDQGSS